MNREVLEQQLLELPLFAYFYVEPRTLEFSQRIRWICEHECPRYGQSWACPPGVGSVEECEKRCKSFDHCLVIGTVAECGDIADMEATLATRPEHEAVTDQVADLMRSLGVEPYILSTDSCAVCKKCTYPEGKSCRHPERMHPCVESHGINLIPTLEENGLPFIYGDSVITWYSLLFFND